MELDMNTGKILSELEKNGFEAYMVGGCVRDMIMGREIHDTDITTNALPQQITEVFRGYKVIPTGIKHGTVTVICGDTPYEITTYRIDGKYSDHRRPDTVEFTTDITDDLARRDFTMNAIAMDREGNIVDPFGGINDIENRIIRCVGAPEHRFAEDALRIMRAVRFSSQLGFRIDIRTARSIYDMHPQLSDISRERLREELDKLICGSNAVEVLMEYSNVISSIIPEFKPCIGLDQRSPYHKFTVWEHIIRAMAATPQEDLFLRRALFFHDIGKPPCMKLDETGRGHFKQHDRVGAEMTETIMKRLRYDKRTIADTVKLIANHSKKLKNRIDVKKTLSVMGDKLFFRLMELKKCDNSAKNPFVADENHVFDSYIEMGRDMIANNECRSIKGLALKGTDLMALGLEGEEIGSTLDELLELVMEERLPNDKRTLTEYMRQRCSR
ncbi:CCA tRNA nucleotidyltransferase [Ruminococcus sp.]|uniref:CCA tRNA nucleotidyltransferase n=1 Tax=Ruminococcus sp. TaxID=41978 RepID=UPI002C5ACC0F|nr:CCA tRNA nucleotidyltransferase [Ruminococcus sp.]HNZ99939.1 CCA tRNA nucleotidyltransferase [Ruminococcus sp.]